MPNKSKSVLVILSSCLDHVKIVSIGLLNKANKKHSKKRCRPQPLYPSNTEKNNTCAWLALLSYFVFKNYQTSFPILVRSFFLHISYTISWMDQSYSEKFLVSAEMTADRTNCSIISTNWQLVQRGKISEDHSDILSWPIPNWLLSFCRFKGKLTLSSYLFVSTL